MGSKSTFQHPILVAVIEQWHEAICNGLSNESFTTIAASSPEETRSVLTKQTVLALIVISDWVFDEKNESDLFELTSCKVPTVTLITRETVQKFGQKQTYERIYNPTKLQDFITAPFSIEELVLRLRRVIDRVGK